MGIYLKRCNGCCCILADSEGIRDGNRDTVVLHSCHGDRVCDLLGNDVLGDSCRDRQLARSPKIQPCVSIGVDTLFSPLLGRHQQKPKTKLKVRRVVEDNCAFCKGTFDLLIADRWN